MDIAVKPLIFLSPASIAEQPLLIFWNMENRTILQKNALKSNIVEPIYLDALSSGQPIFRIVNDTSVSPVKSSSQAFHPLEAAYVHQ